MGLLMFLAVATVPFAGLTVWKLYVRTGHGGPAKTITAFLAIGSFCASLSFIASIVFGVLPVASILSPLAVAIFALLITVAALLLALKPWPGVEL